MAGEKEEQTSWQDKYPEDMRKLDVFKNSADEETLVKRLAEGQTYMGQSIRIPSEEAGDEARAEFYKKLQTKVPGLVPAPDWTSEETIKDAYRNLGALKDDEEFSLPDVEGSELHTESVTHFSKIAKDINLNQAQFDAIVKGMHERQIAQDQAAKEDRKTLVTKWGAAHDQKMDAITVFMAKTDAPPSLQKVTDFADSATLLWLNNLVSAVNQDKLTLVNDRNSSKTVAVTPEEATLKIAEIRNNPKHPYHHANDPSHAAAKSRIRQLYIYADPDNATKPAMGAQT